MVNDLQGFRRGPKDKEEYVLTDPAISCIQRQFDLTDLGEQGIEYFFCADVLHAIPQHGE